MPVDVLVVDDDDDIRATLAELLADEGYSVREVANARDLARALADFSPRLVLLDLTMPGFLAERDLPQLQAAGLLTDRRVLVLSGVADTDVRARALGLDGAVRKPFEVDELLTRVEQICGRRVRPVSPPINAGDAL